VVARKPTAIALSLLLLLAALFVVLYVHDYPRFSPIDEPQHLDYLIKASHGHIVRRGELIGDLTMKEEACHRLDAPFSSKVPPCHGVPGYLPQDFQESGYNTAYIHPPTYYAISGVVARALLHVPWFNDILTAGRLVGVLWLGAAVLFLWLALAELGVGLAPRVAVTMLMVSAPTVLHAAATVNPDTTALAAGAAIVWATLRWERGKLHWIVPAAVALLAVGLKATNALGVGLCLIYVFWRWAQQRRSKERPRYGLLVVAVLVGVVVAVAVWSIVQSALALVPNDAIPMVQRFKVKSVNIDEITDAWDAGWSPLRMAYIPGFFSTWPVRSFAKVIDVVFSIGVVASVVVAARWSRDRALAGATALTLLAFGPGLVLANYMLNGNVYAGAPARYALSAVPAGLAVMASVLLRRRPLALVGLGVASLVTVCTFLALL
jgi:hypothetical protein